jgi:hypothetical protein
VTRSRNLRFSAQPPRIWDGRYRRVPGITTALHVRTVRGEWWPVIDWARGEDVARCSMVDEGDVRQLVTGVNAGKGMLGARPGGAFLVNEHGQVLVPADDGWDRRVVIVGECSGPFVFKNPFKPGEVFDQADHADLRPGDAWERPYVGIPHNLSGGDELYFQAEDERGRWVMHPPSQDQALVRALRLVRPYGPVRFLVGVGGLVLTKVEVRSRWQPRYVGRVDLKKWFAKEV